MRRTCFRFSILDLRCQPFKFRFSNFELSAFEFQASMFDNRFPNFDLRWEKQIWHRKLFDFVFLLLSVYVHYMLEFVYLHHLACQIYSIYTSSATPTATFTLLFYFYIATGDNQSSCPCSSYTSIWLLVTTVPPARALYWIGEYI